MSVRRALVGLGLGLVGCGPSLEKSCEDFVGALEECIDEAFAADAEGLDAAKAALDGACDQYADLEGDAADEAAEVLDCQAKAIEDGDCGDPVAYASTLLDVQGCTSPIPF